MCITSIYLMNLHVLLDQEMSPHPTADIVEKTMKGIKQHYILHTSSSPLLMS